MDNTPYTKSKKKQTNAPSGQLSFSSITITQTKDLAVYLDIYLHDGFGCTYRLHIYTLVDELEQIPSPMENV